MVNATLAVLAIMILTCLVSLMVLFMGGGQETADLRALMFAQVAMVPVALFIAAAGIFLFVMESGWSDGFRLLWQAMPQWLLFIFFLLNSLVGAGELSYVIVKQASNQVGSWEEHVPLVCILACTMAFLILYSRSRSFLGSKPAMSGRWP